MKRGHKILVMGLCAAAALGAVCFQDRPAAGAGERSLRVGVVSLRQLFQESRKNLEYKVQAEAEQQKVLAELNQLSDEVDAAKAALKTRKTDSDDYWRLKQELLGKQSTLEAKKEFYQQHLTHKDQRWTEQLYREILTCTAQVAKQKGFDLVMARDDGELSADAGTTELMLTIRTHKLLYAAEELDITRDVMAVLDAK
jgi:Skp family chaperone for outer membrane proteins